MTLLKLFRNLEQLAAAEDVTHIERLSTPPQVADFDALILEPDDIAALQKCRSGDCLLKLSALITHADRDIPQRLAQNHLLLLSRSPSLLIDLSTIQEQLRSVSPAPPETERAVATGWR